jgi:putative hydrolase of the HAD superfamily
VTEVVLFDLGGVVVELAGVPTFRGWCEDQPSDDEIWERWLRSPAVRRFETGVSDPIEFATCIVDEFSLSVEPADFLEAFAAWPRGPFPGALELVGDVRTRHRVACLSNCNEVHWPRFLGEMRLAESFDHCFSSHELGVLKPDRDVFERVVDHLNCRADAILFLDDNQLNVDGARSAGLKAARVRGPIEARTRLRELDLL